MWRTASLSIAGLAAIAVVAFASPALATTINFSDIPIGGASSYLGPTLDTSRVLNLGGGGYEVNSVGSGDQAGLAPGDFVQLSNPVLYGGGNSGANSAFAATSFTADRSFALDFSYMAAGTGVVPEPVFAILGVSSTSTDTERDPTPIPAALSLFATGLGAIALLVWLRSRMVGTHLTETETTIQTDFFHQILPPMALILGLVLTMVWISFLGYQIGRMIEAAL